MFDLFTGPAKQAVLRAQEEALRLGHDYIGTEDLLAGLAATGGSAAADVLAAHGITAEQVRAEAACQVAASAGGPAAGLPAADALAAIGIDIAEIRRRAEESFGPGRFVFPRPAFTARTRKALELSLSEAEALGQQHVGPEHMLLGLLALGDGVATSTLTALGADPAALRAAILARTAAS